MNRARNEFPQPETIFLRPIRLISTVNGTVKNIDDSGNDDSLKSSFDLCTGRTFHPNRLHDKSKNIRSSFYSRSPNSRHYFFTVRVIK